MYITETFSQPRRTIRLYREDFRPAGIMSGGLSPPFSFRGFRNLLCRTLFSLLFIFGLASCENLLTPRYATMRKETDDEREIGESISSSCRLTYRSPIPLGGAGCISREINLITLARAVRWARPVRDDQQPRSDNKRQSPAFRFRLLL